MCNTSLRQDDAVEDLLICLIVAFAAGFRSKASFNRAFKLYARDTPSGYRAGRSAATTQIVNSTKT